LGIEGLEPSRSKKSTDFQKTFLYVFGLFLYLFLKKDNFHKVSAPFVGEQNGSKFEKFVFSFFDFESIHFLKNFRKAQNG